MSETPGFESWARARWSVLVGSVRSTGAGETEAQDAVLIALAQASVEWREVRDDMDLDARVLGAALHALDPATHPAGAVVEPDLTVPVDPERRQVPLDEVRDRVAAGAVVRRRRVRRLAGIAALALVVVGVGVAGAQQLLEPERPQPAVARADNPVPAPWWADGRLHLDEVVLELSSVRAIAEDGDDVVFEDGEGYGRVDPTGAVEWSERRPDALDEPAPEEVSGYRLTNAGVGGEVAFVHTDGRELSLQLGTDRRVDAITVRPGGIAVLVLSYAPESVDLREYRRLSETGPVLLEACDLEKRSCRRVATVTQSSTALLPGAGRSSE